MRRSAARSIVVEALPAMLAGADQDLVRPVLRRAEKSSRRSARR